MCAAILITDICMCAAIVTTDKEGMTSNAVFRKRFDLAHSSKYNGSSMVFGRVATTCMCKRRSEADAQRFMRM